MSDPVKRGLLWFLAPDGLGKKFYITMTLVIGWTAVVAGGSYFAITELPWQDAKELLALLLVPYGTAGAGAAGTVIGGNLARNGSRG